ncbi:hypothetical protein SPRG_05915 [Saprolegnia parasitica CBS 223.65]|uniref:DUF4097 domain-containing protein n=1 Tax=Saprolegnia parasitica (strain CBS 223.65) TaxID=695850 RepID=A0A067CF44_SAPPC|nr:hypothetical protein SPRG_05915 [Saprolegnia parasitica CBS 223.65]KDO29379.1 hypothetical protein SPRG_05915 [Saprolegnia parasitica CBS 223.65]|eukprot:XP_012199882.1 hypothetical protein SPRG_05915 [Saprolegnia parasitica CBS 223.65]
MGKLPTNVRMLMRQTTLPRISTATPGVQRACIVNFGLSLAGAPMSFVFAQRSEVFSTLFALSGALCVLSVLGAALGMVKTTPSLVLAMLFSIAACYGVICTGGMAILYLPFVAPELAGYTDGLYAQSVLFQQTLADKVSRERAYLIATGVVLLCVAVTSAYVVRKLHFALGEKRSAVTFLQAFGMGMIPFSFILVAGGQYIISSRTLASSPFTGIFTFLCGILVLVLALMAFIGSAFEYRRLLNTFSWFAFILAIFLLASAIASLAVTTSIERSIVEAWPTIRVVLPPTLQARYDQGQFLLFVQRNLRGVAYMAIVSGAFLMLQALSAITLNDITHVVKRRHAQDKRCQLDPNLHPEFVARRDWHRLFKASKKSQRLFMRLSCALAMLTFLIITVLMTLTVVFATQCARLSRAQNATTLPLDPNATTVALSHSFSAGALVVSQGSNGSVGHVTCQQNAISTKYLATATFTRVATSNKKTSAFAASPLSSSYFLGVDTSCQLAVLELVLPNTTAAPLLQLTSSMAEVNINLLSPSEDISSTMLVGINVSTDQANVNVVGAFLGTQALAMRSNSGELNISTIYVNATGASGGRQNTMLASTLGSVSLFNSSLTDSPLVITTDASPIVVAQVTSQVTRGYSSMTLSTQSGSLLLSDVTTDRIELQSTSGGIQTEALTATDNGIFPGRIDVVTIGGAVRMHNTAVDGYVHIESNSGDIYLHLQSTSFVGFYYARSEFGSITVQKSNFSYDTVTALPAQDPREANGFINCGTSCNYRGDIYIRSQHGNINIVLGCENPSCT